MTATLTLTGRLVEPPRLAYAPETGRAVATFTVAESRRTRTPVGDWADGPATFWRCSAFGRQAEHLAESDLQPGDPISVTGRPEGRTWHAPDGTERRAVDVTADTVSVGLTRGPVTVDRRTADRTPAPATGHDRPPHRDRPPGTHPDRWDDTPPF